MSYRSVASKSFASLKRLHACSIVCASPERRWLSPFVQSSHAAAVVNAPRLASAALTKSATRATATPRRRAENASDSPQQQQPTGKSNRQLFREVPVPPSVLEYIQRVGVGIPERKLPLRRRGRKRSRSAGNTFERSEVANTGTRSNFRSVDSQILPSSPPPPPFGPDSRVRAVATVDSLADLSLYLEGGGAAATNSVGISPVPEVALVGRSNVGKSTLLNALLYGNKQRKDTATMVRGVGKGPDKASMSPRPGETKHITWYHISSSPAAVSSSSSTSSSSSRESQDGTENRSASPPASSRGSVVMLRLVDLPGYGFAYSGSKDDLVRTYLLGRDPCVLKRLLLLVDARHGLKQSDVEFLTRWQVPDDDGTTTDNDGRSANAARHRHGHRRRPRNDLPPIQIVLTKCDLVPQIDLARRVVLVRQQVADCLRRETGNLPVMLVAARSTLQLPPGRARDKSTTPTARRDGVLELQREIAALAAPTRR